MFFNHFLDIEALEGSRISSVPIVYEQLTQFTSSVIVQVEEEIMMFIGTSKGRLVKVYIQCMHRKCVVTCSYPLILHVVGNGAVLNLSGLLYFLSLAALLCP